MSAVRIRQIATEFARWLERRKALVFRLNPRVSHGAPHFLIVYPHGSLAILLQRGDDRASSTDRQLETLDELERRGWTVAVCSGVSEAREATEAFERRGKRILT